jgi:hypothetical protein
MRVHGIGKTDLVAEIARVDFDVARFVKHLRRGIEFRIEIRHGLHDLCGADERALLAV